ncbi:WSC domain-containing protein 1-like, partial [Actinia tenebrosa]|uniref:WSC domain-containing protein 1-like n=1 Tax=Actinia tenebrosa TaxID=6105 RepID=A0A6P8HGN2_ACTTE
MECKTLLALIFVIVAGATSAYNTGNEINVESEYLGCYRDDKIPYAPGYNNQMDRALTFPVKNFFGPKFNCVNACAKFHFRYAGLQNGYLCFCGNSFNKYGRLDDKFCNIKCRGSNLYAKFLGRTLKGEFWKDCGGRWANSVYSGKNNFFTTLPSFSSSKG